MTLSANILDKKEDCQKHFGQQMINLEMSDATPRSKTAIKRGK